MCERKGRFIKPCQGVLDALDDAKGFRLNNLVNRETFERSSDRLVLRAGKYRKGGVAFNFCPFTGANIETWEDESVAVAEGGAERPAGEGA